MIICVHKTFNLGLKHRMKCFSFANLAEMLSVCILKKGNIITKAKFTEQKIKTSNKVFKCNRPNCALCECIEEGNCYNFNGKVFYVNETMSCDVKNVIYAIQCNGCKELYIGQTGNKLRTRRTIHAQQIRDPSTRQIPLSEHIDNCSRSIPKFQMFPFLKMHTESISARLAKEKHFIRCFKPKLNVL